MSLPPTTPTDDLVAVRAALGPANPQPDPTLSREEVLAARTAVGLARVAPRPAARPRGRFVAAGAVAVLAVAVLVAIVVVPNRPGGDTVDLATGPGGTAVNAASAATEAAGTARGLLTVTHLDDSVTATGVGDFATGDARAEIALGGGEAPAGTVTVLRTGSGVFVRLPGGTNPLGSAKPWLSVDAATLARLTRLALGDLGAQVNGTPLDAVAYLRAVSGDVAVDGPDTTRGEPTTRYRGTIDPARVVEQLPAALRPGATGPAGAVSRLPVTLWIDAEGRLRKLVVVAEPEPARVDGGRTDGGPVTVTFELFDFGVPVEVEAPPADQVADVGGLLGTLLKDGAGP